MRLVGTTKHTLESIRERSHWNSANLQPMDPVTLGLCSQIDLDFEVNRAAKDRPKGRGGPHPDPGLGGSDDRQAGAGSAGPKFSALPRPRPAKRRSTSNSVFGKAQGTQSAD